MQKSKTWKVIRGKAEGCISDTEKRETTIPPRRLYQSTPRWSKRIISSGMFFNGTARDPIKSANTRIMSIKIAENYDSPEESSIRYVTDNESRQVK